MEKLLLSKIVKDYKDLHLCFSRGVIPSHFLSLDSRMLYGLIISYYNQYKILPTQQGLQSLINSISQMSNTLQTLAVEIFIISCQEPTEFLIDQLFQDYRKSALRSLLVSTVDNININIDDTIKRIEKEIVDIRSTGVSDNSCMDASVDIEERKQEIRIPLVSGIFTGFQTIDYNTGGFQPGELWIVAGYLKSGKTTFMLNCSQYAWSMGKNILYVSGEQSRKSILRRRDSLMSRISAIKLKKHVLDEQELKIYDECLERQRSGPKFEVYDAPACSTSMIHSKIREMKSQGTLDFVCADYIGLFEPQRSGNNEYEILGNVAKELRDIARIETIPILSAHQLKSESLKAKRLGGQHMAGSVLIPRHGDGSIGIRIVDEEEKNLSPWCKIRGSLFATRDCPSVDFELEAAFSIMTIREPLIMK